MATVRSRIAGTWTFVSSKRKARTMCAFSYGVSLFQKSVPASSDRRTSPFPRILSGDRPGKIVIPRVSIWERAAAAEGRLVSYAAPRDLLPMVAPVK
jgi:hypothetical protein